MTQFPIVPLVTQDRSDFHCGTDALDRYFARQVGQDQRRRVAACYAAIEKETGKVAGLYTLSAATIALSDMAQLAVKNMPRYPVLPAVRLGRLAVDQRFQGRKLGSVLLFDAIVRAARSEIAVYAMIVDAKDAAAEAFYLHHNFLRYGSVPGRLMALIDELVER